MDTTMAEHTKSFIGNLLYTSGEGILISTVAYSARGIDISVGDIVPCPAHRR